VTWASCRPSGRTNRGKGETSPSLCVQEKRVQGSKKNKKKGGDVRSSSINKKKGISNLHSLSLCAERKEDWGGGTARLLPHRPSEGKRKKRPTCFPPRPRKKGTHSRERKKGGNRLSPRSKRSKEGNHVVSSKIDY